jgi:hypothetical protein
MKIKAIILKKSGGLRMNYLPIDVKRAKELFYLDETSQSFLSWKKIEKSNPMKVGERAGSYHESCGYYRVSMDNRTYQVHRIVTAIFDNEDPGNVEIDHIDGNKKNNCPSNLRKATFELNRHNCGKRKTNYKGETPTSKYPGVTYHKATGKWQAQIQHKGEKIYLGLFKTELEAYKAYKDAKRAHMCELERESLAL